MENDTRVGSSPQLPAVTEEIRVQTRSREGFSTLRLRQRGIPVDPPRHIASCANMTKYETYEYVMKLRCICLPHLFLPDVPLRVKSSWAAGAPYRYAEQGMPNLVDELTKMYVGDVRNLLLVVGSSTMQIDSLISRTWDNFRAVVDAAIKLRAAIGEDVISCDFETILIHPGDAFDGEHGGCIRGRQCCRRELEERAVHVGAGPAAVQEGEDGRGCECAVGGNGVAEAAGSPPVRH